MKNVPKYLLAISIIVIIGIVWYRFDQYVNQRNFTIYAAVPCDPEQGTCFVMDCDPTEDSECDATPYKKVEVLASQAPSCVEEHTCEVFTCTPGSVCAETYCSDETLEDGEICLVPEEEIVEEEPVSEDVMDEEADISVEATVTE